jgi:hypothetical protein
MKEHDACEQAYMNGYEQGVKDLADRVKGYYSNLKEGSCGVSIGYYVDVVSNEMLQGERSEK